jgi:2-polyprenyl-6-methoxyphenol hydroxylase-like FAD-dependent oxidoreductase
VGGGIGGLCLAQGCRLAGIAAIVFERDLGVGVRAQGYRISLKSAGVQALRSCLPAGLFELAVATSLRPATHLVFTDARLRPKFSKPIPSLPPGEQAVGVNRLTLREILLAGIDDAVHFGAEFHHYEPISGRVRAHFTNGTSADGALLVGADGTNSVVRRQLLPDAIIDDLGWAVYGRTPLDPELLDATPPDLIDTFNRAIDPAGVAVSIATCRPHTPVADAAADHAPTVRLTHVPDYLSWTLTAPGPPPADNTAQALHRHAVQATAHFAPEVRRILHQADPAATFRVAIASAQQVRRWHAPTVTLIGDAVHTMSPGRGDGANITLRDAHLLRDQLAQTGSAGTSPAQAKAEYERQMFGYAFAAVAAARDHPFAAPTHRGIS